MRVRKRIKKAIKLLFFLALSGGIVLAGAFLLWVSTFRLPDLDTFEQRKVLQSTKIYDKTGDVLLYDVHENIKRTIIPPDEMSRHIKNATVAIEDSEFYEHHGVKPTAFLRAVLVNIASFEFSQGGSTITQQVIKNSFLTTEKTISRKLKEWVLAYKLENVLDKEEILALYLNESPYGGNIYGVEEASQAFFSKNAEEVTLAEAAYLAALPQAPTFYSPYGKNREKLDARKDLVLRRMVENNFITEEEREIASKEPVEFNPREERGIKAPHFVIFVREYLIEKYGEDAVSENGYKVITTLDYNLQKLAEDIVEKYALANEKNNNAENAALTAIDPKTGQILVMVGSRNYFDKEIDGNFNVALAHRQPGSTFKPFAYAAAFEKGYLPQSVVFDVPTEFSTACSPSGVPHSSSSGDDASTICYSPENYDSKFRGPISLRNALAQSVNVPSVKTLYLAGMQNTIDLAKNMGINSLEDYRRYGLTLVLGGGEVSLLDLTSAYGTFAAKGVRNQYTGILRIEDRAGNVVEEYKNESHEVLAANTALMISDILSDNIARTPLYGPNSALHFPGYDVAVKTGTTNDYKDVWTVGYTPNIAVGAWAGNNDNTPMAKKISGLIITPMWNAFMQEALRVIPNESFEEPQYPDTAGYPPIIQGEWRGGVPFDVDKTTGKLATADTPNEVRETRVVREIHSILHWIDKNNPRVMRTDNPANDPQYSLWDSSVRAWAYGAGYTDQTSSVIPTVKDDSHTADSKPSVQFISPSNSTLYNSHAQIRVELAIQAKSAIKKSEFYLNGSYIGSSEKNPLSFVFVPAESTEIKAINTLKAVVTDEKFNKGEAIITFQLNENN